MPHFSNPIGVLHRQRVRAGQRAGQRRQGMRKRRTAIRTRAEAKLLALLGIVCANEAVRAIRYHRSVKRANETGAGLNGSIDR